MLDRDKGFIWNAKRIVKRYPEAIMEALLDRDLPMGKKVLWTICMILGYFPCVLLIATFELASGAPFEGACGIPEEEILEDFERDGTLDEADKKRLAEIGGQNKEEDKNGKE